MRPDVGAATPGPSLCIQNDSGDLQDAGASAPDSGSQVKPRSLIINPTAFTNAARKLLAGVWTLALLLLGLALVISWPADKAAAPRGAQATKAKPVEKPVASSMLAESGYAIAKDKLD